MTRPRRGKAGLGFLLTAVAVLSAGMLFAGWIGRQRPAAPSRATLDLPADYSTVPDFKLTERSGREVTRADLIGRVWVAGFLFTGCHETCPMVASALAALRSALPAEVQLVVFSVDPEHDTPAVLSAYAKNLGADSDHWWFLTGSYREVERVAREGFRLPVARRPGGAEAVSHSTRLAVVDRRGRVRAMLESSDPAAVSLLARKASTLAAESP